MSYIIPFSRTWPLREEAVRVIGGKAWSISELVRGAFHVPTGFVISADAFRDFLNESGIEREIHHALLGIKKGNISSIERASEFIRSLIVGTRMPEKISEEILHHVSELHADRVCVRSSAIHEDEKMMSWAGQYQSFVAVTPDAVCTHVRACWASLYSARALAYGGVGAAESNGMAVIVQTFVPADMSGVAFSSHRRDDSDVHIESVWGLGEAAVSGEVTPDFYTISRGAVKEKKVHRQRAEIVAGAHGTTWQTVRERESKQQKLSDEQIVELSRVVRSVAEFLHYEVSVEWAISHGVLWFLQARPRVSLPPRVSETVAGRVTTMEWSPRARHDELLLLYSLRAHGARTRSDELQFPMVESVLLPRTHAFPLVMVSTASWSEILQKARMVVVSDPNALQRMVAHDNDIWRRLHVVSSNTQERIERGLFDEAIVQVKKGIELYEAHGALYYPILTMGMQLTKEHNKIVGADIPLREHDEWRNSMVFSEENFTQSLQKSVEAIVKYREVTIQSGEMMKHLTGREFVKWLDGKMSDRDMESVVSARMHYGYVFVALRDFPDVEVILDRGEVRAIGDYFARLAVRDDQPTSTLLRGVTAWNGCATIEGEAIVVGDAAELRRRYHDLVGKVLVAPHIRPHFIPYLKGVVAIVTDDGGITSHAAIIAREYHIPTIVGTEFATKSVHDGDVLRVDAHAGVVYLPH